MGAHSPDGSVFELTWTPPPAGRVVIYRGQTAPSAGGDTAELPEAALDQIGLGPELLLTQPVSQRQDEQGRPRAVMSGVSWPGSWSRAYFTPVTLLAGRALLGKTLSSVRTGVIGDVDLAEYCNKQALTFDWPAGAAAVVVHLAPKGHDPRNGLTGKSFEISLEEYEKYGGMQFSKQELPATGCSLHLAPVAFSAGRRVVGAIRSVEYAGLVRLQYAVRIGRDPDGWPTHATIALRSQYDLPGSPAFVLINNPQRIPLSMHDGQAVDAAPVNEHGHTIGEMSKELRWSALTTHGAGEMWAANLRGLKGWIRLFVNTPSPARLRTIALLDPPVENLRLTRGGAVKIRYGQLAYTSFDKPGSVGGWQIKQVSGALSAAEAQKLVAGVRTAFDAVDPLPTYPTPEQLERGPRRLAYRRIDARSAGYWHTVPAGPDNTGRPGNVFAHAVAGPRPRGGAAAPADPVVAIATVGVPVRRGRGRPRRPARRGPRPGGGGDQGQCGGVRAGHQHVAAGHAVRAARRGRRRARRRRAGGARRRIRGRGRAVDRPGELPDVARHGRPPELLHLRSRRPAGLWRCRARST